jgi:hypothetical protein
VVLCTQHTPSKPPNSLTYIQEVYEDGTPSRHTMVMSTNAKSYIACVWVCCCAAQKLHACMPNAYLSRCHAFRYVLHCKAATFPATFSSTHAGWPWTAMMVLQVRQMVSNPSMYAGIIGRNRCGHMQSASTCSTYTCNFTACYLLPTFIHLLMSTQSMQSRERQAMSKPSLDSVLTQGDHSRHLSRALESISTLRETYHLALSIQSGRSSPEATGRKGQ